ncbi:hypothetical protein [Methylobacterium brachiatum]|uniref:Uncharacterized protein n=1 Tax=Methylobacterium brachiatum TaxID=269660 RepID=A0ABV1R8C9_9HYPH
MKTAITCTEGLWQGRAVGLTTSAPIAWTAILGLALLLRSRASAGVSERAIRVEDLPP